MTRDLRLVRRGRAGKEAKRGGRETPHGFLREGVDRSLDEAAADMLLLLLLMIWLKEGEDKRREETRRGLEFGVWGLERVQEH